ncbi:hypothetical protein F5Y03DRAFT_360301 [Xylaria venustula]|nr:hypothetical protein F5Y03DRAFT_360301 [Xylaria venustula]
MCSTLAFRLELQPIFFFKKLHLNTPTTFAIISIRNLYNRRLPLGCPQFLRPHAYHSIAATMSSFTLMPFLYQTRTILCRPATHCASPRFMRSLHATCRRPNENTIPFDYEIKPAGEDAAATAADEAANKGTITPTERRIFERIFADIEARGLKPAVQDDEVPALDSTPNRTVQLIMQQAAYDAGQGLPATVVAPGVLAGAAHDRNKALLRFPPPLRGATSKVLDTIKHQALQAKRSHDASSGVKAVNAQEADNIDDDWKAPAHTFPRTLELEAKRQPERTRIEGLITSATSDFELWDILEKEVFTMPGRLGIIKGATESSDSEPSSKSKKRGRKAKLATGDSQKYTLYVHGPLYPAYLLLALRRLDTAFSAPSPLAFSILPRIKNLGLESYVLGVSTPFFNELLAIYWTRRGDLSGMLDLLEEMRHCGVYFDKQTTRILNKVDAATSSLADVKSRNGFGRALMLMPEYEKSQRERLRHWHAAAVLSVQERQDDIGFAEATG